MSLSAWSSRQRDSTHNVDHHPSPPPKPSRASKAISLSQPAQTKIQWRSLFNFTTRKHGLTFFLSAFFAIIVGAITPVQSYLMGKVFTSFGDYAGGKITEDKFKHDMLVSNLWFVALGTVCWVGTSIFFAGWVVFGELQGRSARDRLFKALLGREIGWFEMRKDGVGALNTKVQSFVTDLQTATAQPIGIVLRDVTTAIASLGLAFYQSWKLTLVIISTLPLTIIIVPLISARVSPNIERQNEILSDAAKHVTNSFSVIETVKAYNGQGVENWRYGGLLEKAEMYYCRQVNWNALQSAILRVVTLAMFVQGFWYGATLVDEAKNNSKASGNVLTAFWSCIMATGAMMQVMPQLIALEKGKMAGHRLRMVMAAMSSDTDNKGVDTVKPATCKGDISFEKVGFAYPARPGQQVLKGVSMFFAAGDMAFIIGKSGSGKSTIGQLLMQFYRPSEGVITLDDLDIGTIDAEWVRKNVLLVEQTSVLFNTSIEENIAFGAQDQEEVDLEDVKKATQFSMVRDAIEGMPKGFQTKVGTKGGSLSGGQRQRVALARAKIRDPSILILDESTSALDYINRIAVMEAIRKWRQGRSTIIITHDISQIVATDFVYVMKEGEVVQSGFRRALEAVGGSPFYEFTQTPTRSTSTRSKRKTLRLEKGLSTLPEDSLPDFDEESNDHGSEYSTTDREDRTVTTTEEDPLDWYLNETPNTRASMWVPFMFSPRVGTSNRQSVRMLEIVAPFWSVLPSNQMSNVLNVPILPRVRERKGSTSSGSNVRNSFDPGSPGEDNRFSRRSFRLSRAFTKRLSGSAIVRPKSVMISSKGSNALPVTPIAEEIKIGDTLVELPEVEYDIRAILKTVWPALNHWQRLILLMGLVACLLYAVSTPIFAFVFSKLLATLYNPVDRKAKALKWSIAILGVAIGDGITIFASMSWIQCLAQTWVNQMRRKALQRILEQPREFFDKEGNEANRMGECLDQSAELMQHVLGRFVGQMLTVIVMVSVAIVWSLVSCWKLTLVLFACTPILFLVMNGLSTVGAIMEERGQDAAEHASSIFSETFTSIKTVRTLTLEKHFTDLHTAATNDILKIGIRKGVYVGVFYGLSQSILLYIVALIFYYGSVLLRQKTFPLNSILEVFSLLLLSISTATMILASVPQLAQSREAASRLLRLADLPATCHEHAGRIQIPTIGDISFQNVQFTYPSRPNTLVLRDLNLHIPTGVCIALVGTSGSGKSTIAALLLKLYETAPNSAGNIVLSSRSISQTSIQTLRNLISIVSQTPTLFPTSISGNIVYGLRASDPRNSAANVRAAAVCAGIHDFIASLPEGYDTLIGDGGMGLSGGQAQRIAIARALARQPDVLILDEATSALDGESADLVRDSVQRLLSESRRPEQKALTVIIITHSRDMMEFADRIVMLDQGSVVEEGRFEDLIRRDGKFASLLRGEAWDRDVKRVRRRSVVMMSRVSGILRDRLGCIEE